MIAPAADFPTFVAERFGGKLYSGKHEPNGKACLHEAINVYQGHDWSDDTTGTLDLRALNDARWSSDEARTEAMVPLGLIVLAWPSWSPEKRLVWSEEVAKGVIQRILPPTLRAVAELLPEKAPDFIKVALRCETEGTESWARAAWSVTELALDLGGLVKESERSALRSVIASARSATWAAKFSKVPISDAWMLPIVDAWTPPTSWAVDSAIEAVESAVWLSSGSAGAVKPTSLTDASLREITQIMAEATLDSLDV